MSLLYLYKTINVGTYSGIKANVMRMRQTYYFFSLILNVDLLRKARLKFIMGPKWTFNLDLFVSILNCSLYNLKYILHNMVVMVRDSDSRS